MLADRHYSRRTVGARQFVYSGRKLILRDTKGDVLFAWLWPDADKRMDGQTGFNCAIFRNESSRKASSIILEAERAAIARWGMNRMFTYIDPRKTRVIKRRGKRIVGACYLVAGWKMVVKKNGKPHESKAGQYLFVKLPRHHAESVRLPDSAATHSEGRDPEPSQTEAQLLK
jgi:hypothetical protein